jgi:general stress protein CsbA
LTRSRAGHDALVGVVAYALFFVAGLGFGYAAVGKWKWIPILFPLALALGAAIQQGVDGTWVVRLIVALLVTAGGVLLGALLDARGQRGERARYA